MAGDAWIDVWHFFEGPRSHHSADEDSTQKCVVRAVGANEDEVCDQADWSWGVGAVGANEDEVCDLIGPGVKGNWISPTTGMLSLLNLNATVSESMLSKCCRPISAELPGSTNLPDKSAPNTA
ncbi:hypothetical protein FRX31_014392 [Thalictrum thalictroides]|uniref:Uncharacterized protein n=1 Tax=Thalictrum thalictroides TaxID=46969 RepID=A0A7J6WGH5_THATH|nr:hypothetical protein FRX31_014392 [Thalictrum thalictroides]